jgi:hypothetical protein
MKSSRLLILILAVVVGFSGVFGLSLADAQGNPKRVAGVYAEDVDRVSV